MRSPEFKLTRGEISQNLTCAAAWSGPPELPDPNRWKDLVFAGDACRAVSMRRLESKRSPQLAQSFPWPKETGGTRPMAWLDPIDHVIYRAVVGRLVLPIQASLDSERVFASSVVGRLPGWRLANWGEAIRRRRERSTLMLERFSGMGTLDVRSYFPSVQLTALERMLASLPTHEPTARFLIAWLGELQRVSGIRGLPIGPEPSSVLGNGLLAAADDVCHQRSAEFVRYMDDTWCFVDDEPRFVSLTGAYESALAKMDLKLNADKTNWLTGADARNEVARLAIAYREEALRAPGEGSTSAALELLDHALEEPVERRSELRRALRVLTTQMHPRPARELQDDPSLLRLAPEHWVGYLSTMASSRKGKRIVGLDWLAERATQELQPDSAFENVVFLRALADKQLDKASARSMLETATDSKGWTVPVRVWAAHVWGKSQGFKPERALEGAEQAGDYSGRRAFAMTLERSADNKRMSKWTRKLRLANEELEPTAQWLEAGCP